MGKYLHRFETDKEFSKQYNGNGYLEPWVSLTEHKDGQPIGDCSAIVINNDDEVKTAYYVYPFYDGSNLYYVFIDCISACTITNTGTTEQEGEIYKTLEVDLLPGAIFIGNTSTEYGGGKWWWTDEEVEGIWYGVYTDTDSPTIGSDAKLEDDSNSWWFNMENRNPSIGDDAVGDDAGGNWGVTDVIYDEYGPGELINRVNYNKKPLNYFTTESLGTGVLSFIPNVIDGINSISYSTDGGITWITPQLYDETEETSIPVNIDVSAGDRVLWKGDATYYGHASFTEGGYGGSSSHFECTCQYKVYGNIMSLLYGDDFKERNTLPEIDCESWETYGFVGLFVKGDGFWLQTYGSYDLFVTRDSNLVDVSGLILPATALTKYSYSCMFFGCCGLSSGPVLPATTLDNICYSSMFAGCSGLTTAPELPATTLADYCYEYMFLRCTSLTTAPELPATTLAGNCYSYMFAGCTSLTTAPELPATTLAEACYAGIFQGCTSLTEAPELPVITLADSCYSRMFQGCTGLTTAPELPATTLANYCYNSMFQGCTGLTTAPELPATTLTDRCYVNMFSNCTNLNYIKCLATTNVTTNNTYYWTYGVSSTGTFVKDPNMSSWTTGVSGIPTNWTIQDAS